jgi:hypothetical protein
MAASCPKPVPAPVTRTFLSAELAMSIHHQVAGVVGLVADAVTAELVDVVEEVEEPLQPGGPVGGRRLPESVEQVGRHPVGVVRCL